MANKKKVYFRADADKTIGFGHFIRSLALADILKMDFDCTFFTQMPTKYQKAEVEKVCKLVELPADETKFEQFLDFLQGDEIIVLDNYFFSSEYQKRIKDKGCKLICLGTNDRHYYADILFNYAENDASIFSVEPYTQLKLGIDWAILRDAFRNIHEQQTAKKQRSIVICFGGTDQFYLTEKCVDIIEYLSTHEEIHLIAVDSFGKERIKLLERRGVKCHVNATAEQIVEVFSSACCLISSASTITQEALACQVPVICGYYVDNQKKMYNYLVNNNLVLGMSDWLSPDMQDKLLKYINNLDIYKENLQKKSFKNLEDRYLLLFKNL
jgi:spore coat polysaccharide biosynthesis predicted glycosyltransferase SpsG